MVVISLSPLCELLGKRAGIAAGEILKAEVVVELQHRLLVGEAAEERGRVFL
jgi:hypothetical protein